MHQSATPILDFVKSFVFVLTSFFLVIYLEKKIVYKRGYIFSFHWLMRGFLFYTNILLAQKEWKASIMYHTFCTNKVL